MTRIEEKVSPMMQIKVILELTKFRISLFATLSTAAGFILARQEISNKIIMPLMGILFLACGSCALNQYQERRIDGWMKRTKGRPLPAGKLNPLTALGISSGLISLGSFILFCGTNWVAWGLGLFAVLWYNGIYTYLKQKTAFAAVPGALVGVIPPVLGWVSGGGRVFDPRIWVVAFFFFIWQVPHFWLLLLDSAGDYERAGLPSLTGIFSAGQLKRIVFIWILSTGVSCLLIPLFGFVNFYFIHLSLIGATFWLVWEAMTFFRSDSNRACLRFSFTSLNLYVLGVISLLSLDSLLCSSHMKLNLFTKVLAMIGFKPV